MVIMKIVITGFKETLKKVISADGMWSVYADLSTFFMKALDTLEV